MKALEYMVGVAGFEPATPSSRTGASGGETTQNRDLARCADASLHVLFRAKAGIPGRLARFRPEPNCPFLPGYEPRPIYLGESISWTPSIRTAQSLWFHEGRRIARRSRPQMGGAA